MILPADVQNKGMAFIRAHSKLVLAQHQFNHSKKLLRRAENARGTAACEFTDSVGFPKLSHKNPTYMLVSGKTLEITLAINEKIEVRVIEVKQ